MLISDALRTAWIEQRLEFLASLFAVDVLEYAIMSNHLHLLLRIRPELAACWTAEEVATRWITLRNAGPLGIAGKAEKPSGQEIADAVADEATTDEWRRRLGGLSWFHKELKEPCARMWNAEDDESGPFWQGRYSSKIALDDVAVTVQALYILLNPVRAGMESGIGRSSRTSIGARMKRIVREIRSGGHRNVVAAFERRVVEGLWMPVFPCDPGLAASISDADYAERVARFRHGNEIRRAMQADAETLARLATDASVDELLAAIEVEEHVKGDGDSVGAAQQGHRPRPAAISHAKLPRHRLRPRQSSLPPSDVRRSHLAFLTAMENPFRPDRVQAGSMAVIQGMTLGALLSTVDDQGRSARPDKKGVIPSHEPRALDRFLLLAMKLQTGTDLNDEDPVVALDHAPGCPETCADSEIRTNVSCEPTRIVASESAASPALNTCVGLTSGLATQARWTINAAIGTLASQLSALGRIVHHPHDAHVSPAIAAGNLAGRSDGNPGREARVRWFGSASGPTNLLDEEAERRGSSRVVGERPLRAN